MLNLALGSFIEEPVTFANFKVDNSIAIFMLDFGSFTEPKFMNFV